MGCPCSVSDPTQYLSCAGDQVRLVAPQSVMTQFAAQAGASSGNWTMCLTMAFLAARRMEYWKVSPGDCGSPGTAVLGSTYKVETGVIAGLRVGASVDPEPISKGILAGVAAIFGGFTAHHAQAVATEQQVLCGVTNGFNYVMSQIETALSNGQISNVTANAILENSYSTLNAALSQIKKGQNAAWGYSIAMAALKNFAEQVIFPALYALGQGSLPPALPASFTLPTAPPALASYFPPAPNANPLSTNVGGFQGSSGYIPQPMNGQNSGVGVTTNILPFSITPGTIILIGGVAFVASQF